MPARSTTTASRSVTGWKTRTICCNSMAAWGRTISSDRVCRPSCRSISLLRSSEKSAHRQEPLQQRPLFVRRRSLDNGTTQGLGDQGVCHAFGRETSDIAGHRPLEYSVERHVLSGPTHTLVPYRAVCLLRIAGRADTVPQQN